MNLRYVNSGSFGRDRGGLPIHIPNPNRQQRRALKTAKKKRDATTRPPSTTP
jgi:hypothetical protein